MQDFSKPVRCEGCGQPVYEVPTSWGVEQFEPAGGQWHACPRPNGILNAVWKVAFVSLHDASRRLGLPEPQRFAVFICFKYLPGASPLHLVAMKTVLSQKVCAFFRGTGTLELGGITVLCGTGQDQTLLTNSKDVLRWDGEGRPEHLALSHRWLETD